MVTLDQFREALGPKASGLSDDEIMRINGLMERTAWALFDGWHKKLTHSKSLADGDVNDTM